MNAVVNEQGGTAFAARIKEAGLEMAGKTGTSQVRRISQYERDHGIRKAHEVPWKERDHALFVGLRAGFGARAMSAPWSSSTAARPAAAARRWRRRSAAMSCSRRSGATRSGELPQPRCAGPDSARPAAARPAATVTAVATRRR